MAFGETELQCHEVYLASGPEHFVPLLERVLGRSMDALLAGHVPLAAVNGCVLVGAIPLGVARPSLPIELVVLVDAGCAWSVSTSSGGATISLQFVATEELLELVKQLSAGKVEWDAHQAELLSRIKTGWILRGDDLLQQVRQRLNRDRALEMHCTARNIVLALKYLEDAVAALADNRELALHLGRMCVESCFAAHFTSLGYALRSEEWLRLCLEGPDRTSPIAVWALLSAGILLLFPVNDGAESSCREYLRRVRQLLLDGKAIIEKDYAFKLAFRMARQIYVPPPLP